MPTAINVDGRTTYRPGVYGKVDASSLAGRVLTINRVAVIGDLPFLEEADPVQVNTPRSMADLAPNDPFWADIVRFLYTPARDDRVRGGPSAVIVCNAAPTTAAAHTLLESTPIAAMVVTSLVSGFEGNQTSLFVENNAVDATLRDFTIGRPGYSTEEFVGLGSGVLLEVEYDGGEATLVELSVTATEVNILQAKSGIALGVNQDAGGPFDITKLAWSGTIAATPSLAAGAGETHTLTIDGVNKATGAPLQEVLTWITADGVTQKTTTGAFSDVTQVTWATTDVTTPTVELVVDAFDLLAASYPTLTEVQATINGFASRGYHATFQSPKAPAVPTDELDYLTATSINGTTANIRADLKFIVDYLNVNSALVSTARSAGAGEAPVALAVPVYLSGGGYTAGSLSDWEAALVALEQEDVQIVLPLTTDAGLHDAVRAHCVKMAGAGANERCAWLAAAAGETKSQLFTRTLNLNTRHCALVGQEAQVRRASGLVEWADPLYLATMCAGIQAGTDVGVPMTRKVPNLLGVRSDSSWDANEDADEMIANGLVIVTRAPRIGLRIERSVTTHLLDDNPIWSEVSANESLNTSVRSVRNRLDLLIGDPGFKQTRGRIETETRADLRLQVLEGVIKDFKEDSVTAEDLGDRWRVNATVAPVEPINFIEYNVTAARTPFNA